MKSFSLHKKFKKYNSGKKFIKTYIVHSSLTEKIHEDQQQFRHHGHHRHTEVVLMNVCTESGWKTASKSKLMDYSVTYHLNRILI